MSLLLLVAALQTADPLAVVVDPIRPDQNVLHYDVRVSIPDTGTVIRGATGIRWRVEGPTGPLRLDFDAVFRVDSVTGNDGRPVPFRLSPDGQLTVEQWGAVGETMGVTVWYAGTPADGLFLQPNVHGDRTVFADNWPNRAHHWFPSEDHPSDKATVAFAVEVPSGWRTIANGVLQRVDSLARGRTRWHWRTERQIPVYTMVIGGGRMAVTSIDRGGGPAHAVWTFPEDSAFAVDGPFRQAHRMLQVYTDLVGPFPYAKLAHVQSSTRFGGMENSSAIFYSEAGYARRSMGDGVVAHETAHQWFGDAVTEYDWHHLWLSEGFASYFGPLFFERIGDEGRFRRDLASRKASYLASEVVDRPVIDTAETDYFRLLNANNYPKGAWILHMLRREVGDEAFFRGVRDYYAAYRDSTALSSDLLRVMEQSSGRSLRWFFEQWLTQPGYPQLAVDWTADGGDVRIRVRQIQPEAWGMYRLEVPLVVETRDWTHRGVATFDGASRDVVVRLPVAGTVDRVRLDLDDLLAAPTSRP